MFTIASISFFFFSERSSGDSSSLETCFAVSFFSSRICPFMPQFPPELLFYFQEFLFSLPDRQLSFSDFSPPSAKFCFQVQLERCTTGCLSLFRRQESFCEQ